MCGVPCVYYGSEWGIEGEQHFGDYELRPALDEPEWNGLTSWISVLAKAREASDCLSEGTYRQLAVSPLQLVFERARGQERVVVAINADSTQSWVAFDGDCGEAHDLLSGVEIEIRGGIELEPYGVYYLQCD